MRRRAGIIGLIVLATCTLAATPASAGSGQRRSNTRDQVLIMQAVRDFFTAGRTGNAKHWCGQQTDRRLRHYFGSGGLDACLQSSVANTPDAKIPDASTLSFTKISVTGNYGKVVAVSPAGTVFRITMLKEAGPGGWAVDTIKNS